MSTNVNLRQQKIKVVVNKRKNGVYYTCINPFKLKPFETWARKNKIVETDILEPFAGANNIITMLKEVGTCRKYTAYDIDPKQETVVKRNTIKNFPIGHKTCITNPPWLTSYFAKRKGIYFPDSKYDNLYKICLDLALQYCDNVGFIIPGTFVRTRLFRERLSTVIFINKKLFTDTDHPVCIALFEKHVVKKTKIYNDDEFIGTLEGLEKLMPRPTNNFNIKFNDPNGKIGLYGIDNTNKPTIRFCRGDEIQRPIIHSDRLITRISINRKININSLNQRLDEIRKQTHDVFFAPFKGLRKDGKYRRRIDYEFVRNLLNEGA